MGRGVRIGLTCVWLAALPLGCRRTEPQDNTDAGKQPNTVGDAATPSDPPASQAGASGRASSGAAGSFVNPIDGGGSQAEPRDGGSNVTPDPMEDPLPCDQVPQVIDKADLLFMVDNSGSMKEEQASLREQLPRVVQVLTTGDLDGDGMREFPPATDLHLGVVSSDMGLVSIQDIDKCEGLGDDGILLNTPNAEIAGCQASYPRFLTYLAGQSDALTTANDFACISALGTEGCGFEQQLESVLKALWPSTDTRVTFLGDANGFGRLGQGDTVNVGFLRNDRTAGRSLIAVIVVSDEEDCSSADTRHFTPMHFLEPTNPLAMQDLNLRCFYNPQNLYPIQRYVNGLKELRPENPGLVLFAAVVGVPPAAVSAQARANVDFNDRASREGYYTALLAHPDMQERVDTTRTPQQGQNLVPSCNTDRGRAYPPRRIVETARGFAENGVVQSICDADFGPAIDAILSRIGDRLREPCRQTPE